GDLPRQQVVEVGGEGVVAEVDGKDTQQQQVQRHAERAQAHGQRRADVAGGELGGGARDVEEAVAAVDPARAVGEPGGVGAGGQGVADLRRRGGRELLAQEGGRPGGRRGGGGGAGDERQAAVGAAGEGGEAVG